MKFSILFSFVFLIAYALSAFFHIEPLVMLLFSLSPLLVLYVVYKVLKDPHEVKESFEEHFYQDGSHPRSTSNG